MNQPMSYQDKTLTRMKQRGNTHRQATINLWFMESIETCIKVGLNENIDKDKLIDKIMELTKFKYGKYPSIDAIRSKQIKLKNHGKKDNLK